MAIRMVRCPDKGWTLPGLSFPVPPIKFAPPALLQTWPGFLQPVLQHGVSFADGYIADRIAQCLLCPDQDKYFLCPGYAGIDEVALKHHEMIHQDRHDHDRVLRALGFVDGRGIGQDKFVQFGDILGNRPAIEDDGQLPVLRIDGVDHADIAVKDFLFVVVPDLHDFVSGFILYSAAF